MDGRNVVITGVGLVGALGSTALEFAGAWRNGRSAEKTLLPELGGTPLGRSAVGRLPEFDAAARLGGRRMLKFMSEASVLGCVTAREALRDAAAMKRFPAERIGIYAGTGIAAANVNEVQGMVEQSIDEAGSFSTRLLGERGLAATNPLLSFKILANMPPCLISVVEGIKGPNLIFTPWEGQTASAIVEGWRAVLSGEVDCALVGGADTAAYPSTFVYLRQSGRLRKDEYPSSGAGYLVLESAETAARDGVRQHARVGEMEIVRGAGVSDPLSERVGRTFAAAPALSMGVACCCGWDGLTICGVDRQELRVTFEGLS